MENRDFFTRVFAFLGAIRNFYQMSQLHIMLAVITRLSILSTKGYIL